MWILTVRPANAPSQVFVLKKGLNTLGRNPDNDIVITDDSISRRHAEIHCHADRVVIRDLDSRNGTFVNLARLSRPKVANSGDQIHFGQCLVHLFRRSTGPFAGLPGNDAETKPRVREMGIEPTDKSAALLFDVANRLMASPQHGNTLPFISGLIRDRLGCDRCEILLPKDFDRLGELGFSITIARQAVEQHTPILFPDPELSGRLIFSPEDKLGQLRSALCVPVLIETEVAGLVYLYRTDPGKPLFDPHDTRLVTAISHQVALTIQRARLEEQTRVLKKWAFTDDLTGLDNRRYTLEMAELVFQRAQSLELPLAVLMLDLDRFKQINDRLGHPVGDQVLKAAAERLRNQLRSIDLLGRYGGDEFIVLLIDTGLEGAQSGAERLKQAVALAPIATEAGPVPLTVSIGLAVLDPDCPSLTSLIEQADRNLYASRRTVREENGPIA